MAEGPDSKQEAFMATWFGRSMSAPFLYFPEKWTSGPGADEPADIVWACNNCVILMYLTQSKDYADEDKNRREFRKDQRHNLKQAKARFRQWKRYHLTGGNAYHRFWLKYKKETRVVILSVVKAGDDRLSPHAAHTYVEVHADLAADWGVKVCATIPQSFLENLIRSGGSALDLLLLLEAFNSQGQVPEAKADEILRNYILNAWHTDCDLHPEKFGLPGYQEGEKLAAIMTGCLLALGKLRHRPMASRRDKVRVADSENIGAKYAMLADMDLTDFYTIGKSLGICTRLVQTTGESQYIHLGLAHHDCGVLVVETRKDLEEDKKAHESMVLHRKAGTMRPGMDFTYVMGTGRVSFSAEPRSGPSQLEQVVDTFGKTATAPQMEE